MSAPTLDRHAHGAERRTDNWTLIVAEYAPKIGRRYRDHRGDMYRFFGIVHGDDDYYYGMFGGGKLKLLSCVGSIEGHGFEEISDV